MAEKYPQGYPLAPASVMPRSDEESAAYESRELKKKKRMKCFAYIVAFAVFQTAIILVFALVVMRVRTPKVRLEDVSISDVGNGNRRLTARLIVKNTNFGHYKFESTVATVSAGGATVGQFVIPDARARARSTKKVYIISDINASGNSSGVLALTAQARLRGKVQFMKVLKRKKSADMNCSMSVILSSHTVEDVNCR